MNILKITALTLVTVISTPLFAAPQIQYTQDNRYTHHTIFGYNTPSSNYANFYSDNWGYEAGTSQTSLLTSTTISATGGSYTHPDAFHYGAHGKSIFDISFTVTENSTLNITANVQGGWDTASFILYQNGSIINSTISGPYEENGGENVLLNLEQALLAGSTYRIFMQAESYSPVDIYDWSPLTENKYSLNANLVSSVPLPPGIFLFASGIAGVALLKRKKQA